MRKAIKNINSIMSLENIVNLNPISVKYNLLLLLSLGKYDD